MYPCLLKQGPWSFYDKCFNKEKEIFLSRDFFITPNSFIMQKLLVNFYESFKIIANSIDSNTSFLELNPSENILYFIFFFFFYLYFYIFLYYFFCVNFFFFFIYLYLYIYISDLFILFEKNIDVDKTISKTSK